MTGINDRLNWDKIIRTTKRAKKLPKDKYQPIPPVTSVVDSPAVIIGMSSKTAKPNWWLAGNVSMVLLTSPSSTSQFQVGIEAYRQKIPLGLPTLVRLPDWQLQPYLLRVEIAKWHTEMFIEVWKYSGDELDGDVARHIRIEEKIDDISQFGL